MSTDYLRTQVSAGAGVGRPLKVLFFSHDAKLGDAIVNTAFVAALDRHNPQCEIHATVSGVTAGFWSHDARVKKLWRLQKPGWRETVAIARAMRRERYDFIVTWQRMRSEKNRLLLWLAKSARVIDLHAYNQGPVRHKIDSCAEALRQMGQGGQLGGEGQAWQHGGTGHGGQRGDDGQGGQHGRGGQGGHEGSSALAYDPRLAPVCAQLDAQFPPGREVIVVNLFAADAERNVGPLDARALVTGLRAQAPDAALCLVCTDQTQAAAQAVSADCGGTAQIVNCEGNLNRLFRLCERADLVVSPDTALVHIASAFDTPVIGIYQNNGVKAVQWGPRSRRHALVLSASPERIDGFSVAQLLEHAAALRSAHVHPD